MEGFWGMLAKKSRESKNRLHSGQDNSDSDFAACVQIDA